MPSWPSPLVDWEAWRGEFPILARKTYLNTCSLGPLSRRARAAVGEYLGLWEEHGASAWYGPWLGQCQRLRERVARLVGGRPEEVALHANVSGALGTLASALDLTARPEVVTSDLDFPTVPHQFLARPGVRVRFARSADGVTVPPEAFEEHLSERTGAVATTHVAFLTGALLDVAAIARAARRVGAPCFLDSYHGLGQVPFDAPASGVDAVIGGGLKWLLGGTGIAFVWVRGARHAEWAPQATGWFAHARQFDFDAHRFEPQADARRFETGTPSMASVYAAEAGLGVIEEIGVARLRRRTLELAEDLRERALDAKLTPLVAADPGARTGVVPIAHPDPARAVAALAREGIIVDKRPGRVRVSPFFYNTPEENEKVVRALAATV